MGNAMDKVSGDTGRRLLNFGAKARMVFDALAKFTREQVVPALRSISDFVVTKVVPALKDVAAFIQTNVLPVVKRMADFFVQSVLPALEKVYGALLNGVRSALHSVSDAIERNRPQLEKLGDVLGKIAKFIVEKVAPVVGVVLKQAFKYLGGTISATIDIIGKVVTVAGKIGSAFSTAADAVKGAFRGIVGYITSAINKAIDAINVFIKGYNKIPGHKDIGLLGHVGGAAKLGGSSGGRAQVALAAGGIVTRPMRALIGEAGPEAVIPLNRARGGFGNTYNITIQSSSTNPDELGRQIVRAIRRHERVTGAA
jgi:hypothetical protein